MFARHFGVKALRVGAGVKTGMRIEYESRELGPDRIAVALGALRLHVPPLIVVSLGTGTVFEAVSRDGVYLGGAIAPGIGVATEALAGRAAMLSSVELSPPKKAIGTNTTAAMQSGVVFGYAELIEGMVRRFKAEVGEDAWVVGTGGWAPMMSRLTTCFDRVDEDLSLHGLRQVYEMNEGS
jgi:type III pantothenate kinase